jgi:hypothetical protein
VFVTSRIEISKNGGFVMSKEKITVKPFYKRTPLIMLIAIFSIVLAGCAESDLETVENNDTSNDVETVGEDIDEQPEPEPEEVDEELELEDYMKDKFTLKFETGLDLSGGISDEDYEKYNSIMDELTADWDRSEQEIYADIADEYNSTAEELEAFMNENSNAVLERDFKGGASIDEEDMNEFVSLFMNENFNAEIEISNIESSMTSYRAISHFDFKILDDNYDETHSAILNYEYDVNNNYKTASVFQFKIDEKNIDKVSNENE